MLCCALCRLRERLSEMLQSKGISCGSSSGQSVILQCLQAAAAFRTAACPRTQVDRPLHGFMLLQTQDSEAWDHTSPNASATRTGSTTLVLI